MEHFFSRVQVNQKQKQKKVFTRNGTLFLSTELRSEAHQSQIIGGDADENHTEIVGGYTVKWLGVIYAPIPPPPLVSALLLYSPFVGLSTKMQNKKHHVFSTSETVFRTEINQKVI